MAPSGTKPHFECPSTPTPCSHGGGMIKRMHPFSFSETIKIFFPWWLPLGGECIPPHLFSGVWWKDWKQTKGLYGASRRARSRSWGYHPCWNNWGFKTLMLKSGFKWTGEKFKKLPTHRHDKKWSFQVYVHIWSSQLVHMSYKATAGSGKQMNGLRNCMLNVHVAKTTLSWGTC